MMISCIYWVHVIRFLNLNNNIFINYLFIKFLIFWSFFFCDFTKRFWMLCCENIDWTFYLRPMLRVILISDFFGLLYLWNVYLWYLDVGFGLNYILFTSTTTRTLAHLIWIIKFKNELKIITKLILTNS